MRAVSLLIVLSVLAIALIGCGSGESPLAPSPSPEPPGGDPVTREVGPFVVRTAASAGFVAESIPSDWMAVSMVAFYGARIDYLASQAMLDRIVFASQRDGVADIWVCNLDGSDPVQLTANNAEEWHPCWSPDGSRIAFTRAWPGQDAEIVLMNADGSGIQALTANVHDDEDPTFSPDGRRIAFESDRSGNFDIWTMYVSGSDPENLTNDGGQDRDPDWSPLVHQPRILFASDRGGTFDIYRLDPDYTTAPFMIAGGADDECAPSHHPFEERMAFHTLSQGAWDVFVTEWSYLTPHNLSATPGDQEDVAWSTDARHLCYASHATGDFDLVLQEQAAPYGKWALTSNTVHDAYPDLGSRTLQTDRVLIGPPGSDWGGTDPVWDSAYAGIAVSDTSGYLNFVRIGIRPHHADTLRVSPLVQPAQPADLPVGVVLEAAEIINLREDAGRGLPPTVWDLDPADPGAVVIYFSGITGKLTSVIVLRDSAYPAAAGGAARVAQRAAGDHLVLDGDFAAVFDASGNRVAGASTRVTIGADGAAEVGG